MTQYLCYSEITQQRDAWQQAVDHVLSARDELQRFFAAQQPDEIIFLACGSPYYLGQSAAMHWQRQLGVPARAVMGSEMFMYPETYLPITGKRPLVVVVSRSGSTSEVQWALDKYEKLYPGRALLVGCTPDSPLSQRIAQQIMLPAANEQTIAQTRSFAAMYLATQLIASVVSDQQPVIDALSAAPRQVDGFIAAWEETIAGLMTNEALHNFFYLGSGPLFGIAQEATLKITEMSITEAFAYPFLESRHGPRSLIDDSTMVVGLFGQSSARYEKPVLDELRQESTPHTLALAPASLGKIPGAAHTLAVETDWPDSIQGLAYLPLVQLLAYYRAITKGVNPDESRNLVPFIKLDDEGNKV